MTIAAVTASLHELVRGTVDQQTEGVPVRIGPPSAVEPGEAEVSLCFYRLEANAALRNRSRPSRTPQGSARAEARNAFDLHYLIAFAGESLDAETMLGNVLAALGAMPVLVGEHIQPEPIRLTPEYLSLEDLTRLWRAFQLPLRPSLQLVASPVMLGG